MVRRYDEDAVPSVYGLDDIPPKRAGGSEQRFFRGLDTLVGVTRVEPGRDAEPHSHPWEQVTFVLEGGCRFHVGEESVRVSAGDIFLVPPDVAHMAEATGDPCTLVFAGPLREDVLEHTDYQAEFPDDGSG